MKMNGTDGSMDDFGITVPTPTFIMIVNVPREEKRVELRWDNRILYRVYLHSFNSVSKPHDDADQARTGRMVATFWSRHGLTVSIIVDTTHVREGLVTVYLETDNDGCRREKIGDFITGERQ